MCTMQYTAIQNDLQRALNTLETQHIIVFQCLMRVLSNWVCPDFGVCALSA